MGSEGSGVSGRQIGLSLQQLLSEGAGEEKYCRVKGLRVLPVEYVSVEKDICLF